MSTVRPNLKGFALANFDTTDIIFSTGFAIISPHCKTDSQFIYEALYSEIISRQIYALLVGSNYPAINNSDVENLAILYPPTENERLQISTTLRNLGTEIIHLQRISYNFQQQKRGLMQHLLTGKVRVNPQLALL